MLCYAMKKLLYLIFALIRIGAGLWVGLLLMGPVFPLLTDAGWHPREGDSLTKLILYGVGGLGIPMTIFGFLGFKYAGRIGPRILKSFIWLSSPIAYTVLRALLVNVYGSPEVAKPANKTPEGMKAIRKKAIVGTMNENSSARVIIRPTPANPKQIGEAKAWHTNDLNWRRWIAIPLIVLVIIGFSGFFVGQKTQSANAADPADLQQLKDIGVCVRCDLRGASLWLTNLEDTNLLGANLRGASLWFSTLEGANLMYADLRAANLYKAILVSANLKGANLKGANLKGANLKDAILCNTTMPDGSVTNSGC